MRAFGCAVLGAILVCTPSVQAAEGTINWTGSFVGLNGGGAWGGRTGQLERYSPFFAVASTFNPDDLAIAHQGYFAGVQFGYNRQSGRYVLGFEADIQAAQIGSTSNLDNAGCAPYRLCANLPDSTASRDRINWFGTTRGRAGVSADALLIYVTGGVAFGGVGSSSSIAGNPGAFSGLSDSTKVGWTVGAGVEWALNPKWTIKAEYLHVDLGSTHLNMTDPANNPGRTLTYIFHHSAELARVGVNYQFDRVASATRSEVQLINWKGWYAGLNSGGSWSGATGSLFQYNPSAPYDISAQPHLLANHNGGFGGAQVGNNWQVGPFVYGVETDIQAGHIGARSKLDSFKLIEGGAFPSTNVVAEDKVSWFGTFRGRLGITTGEALFYATAGAAYGGVRSSGLHSVSAPFAPAQYIGSTNETKLGWVVGAGIEWAFAPRLSLKGEYALVDLGTSDVAQFSSSNATVGSLSYRFHHSFNSARIGLNYKFEPTRGR